MAESSVLYFEDLEKGVEYTSPGRTITVGDIVNFAGLSGDFSELHMNDEFGSADGQLGNASLYPGRIAHGLLGLAVQSGLTGGVVKTAGLAFLGINWRFRKAIYPGDTIYVDFCVADKRLSVSRPGTGVVTWSRRVRNQRGETVQEGETMLLVRCRESTSRV